MRARFAHRVEVGPHHPDFNPESVKDKRKKVFYEVGDVIEHPNAFTLVRMGIAEPADDECREAANMTDEQIELAIQQQELVGKGIHPSDYDDYKSGKMSGYNPDGTNKPGPNAEKPKSSVIWLP